MRTKNRFFTFICALIPGAGQMYQGHLKRGVSIMAIFCGIIAFTILIDVPAILFLAPIIWFYSFFDVINKSKYTADELDAIEDKFIFADDLVQNEEVGAYFKERHKWIGYAVLIIGLLLLYSGFLGNLLFSFPLPEAVYYLIRKVPTLAISAIIILLGIKLIKGSKKEEMAEVTEDTETMESDSDEAEEMNAENEEEHYTGIEELLNGR